VYGIRHIMRSSSSDGLARLGLLPVLFRQTVSKLSERLWRRSAGRMGAKGRWGCRVSVVGALSVSIVSGTGAVCRQMRCISPYAPWRRRAYMA
jgi:hypothetical protein